MTGQLPCSYGKARNLPAVGSAGAKSLISSVSQGVVFHCA